MTGYVLELMTFTFEKDKDGEIYRCHNGESSEVYWTYVNLNRRMDELKNKKCKIEGVDYYDGIEVTLCKIKTEVIKRLDDITYD